MGQKIASLEIELGITTGGAAADIARFGGVVDKVTAQAVRDLDRIDVAIKGVGDMSPATASMVKYAEETAKSAITAAREMNRIERAGESLSSQLDRQISTFGKTTAEIRAMKVETAALAAAEANKTELAARLRAQEQQLWEMEYAAARKAEQEERALAESRDQAAAAAEREAQATRAAGQAHQQFEAYARKAMQAYRDQQAAEAAVTAETDRLAAAGERLRMSIDPAYASQRRFDQEMAVAKQLVGAGAVTLDEYCAKLRVEKTILDEAALAHRRVGAAQRFTAAETLNLSRQFQDIGVTAAMGMNPLMIMVQQGPQIYDVLEQAKMRGVSAGAALKQMGLDAVAYGATGLGKLATYLTPVNLLLAGTAVAAIAALRALGTYDAAMRQFETTAAGLGRVSGQTAAQLEAIAEAAATSGQRSIGATRDSVAAFAAAGIQGGDTLTLLAANVERYAKLTGQDVPAAQKFLADAMKDPAKAADTFTESLGLLSGAQYEHIKQLAAAGEQEQAAAEITRILTGDLAANAHQTTGLAAVMHGLGSAVSGAVTWFGRLDQKVRDAGASYDAWLKQYAGSWAVYLFGTGNQVAPAPNPNAGRNQDQIAALNASQSLNTTGMRQYNDLLAQQSVLQKGLANTTGLTAGQIQGLRHDYAAITDTINANRDASGHWLTTQERSHQIAQAQARMAATHNQQEKAAQQQIITRLQLGTQVLTQQERTTAAVDAYNKVADKYQKPKVDRHAEELEREIKATEAQIVNLYKLADAYDVSAASALIAEARVKAESKAIKDRGDVDAAINREIRLMIAQRVADGEKASASLRDQAKAQEAVNAMVAAGLIPSSQAATIVRDRIADLPALQAIEAAQQRSLTKEAERATRTLNEQRDARERNNAAVREAQFLAAMEGAHDELERLEQEARLIGVVGSARIHQIATLKAWQEAQKHSDWGIDDQLAYVASQVAIADKTHANTAAQDALNRELAATADLFARIDDTARLTGQGLSDAFGKVGRSVGDALSAVTGYYAQQSRLEAEHRAEIKRLDQDQAGIDRENDMFARRSADARMAGLIGLTSAAKSMFDEHSKGYKIMEAAEKGLAVVQLARTAIDVAGGAAKMFATLGPFAFPAVAAMLGVMASLGFAGGGSAGAAPITNTGTGTVLGDSSAKSDSLKRSIDLLGDIEHTTMIYSGQMLTALKSIDQKMGGVASLIARSGNVNASAGITEGFKANSTAGSLVGAAAGGIGYAIAAGSFAGPIGIALGAILGTVLGPLLKGLFGTKTTIVGEGIYGGPQALGDILSDGYNGQTFTDVEKKKKFFGITTSTKYSTQYGALDPALSNQFALILRGFNDAIAASAGPLGIATDDVAARLKGFVVDLGKIDLKGLTGEQIQEKLENVFGAEADRMAQAAIPGLERFAKVGEGYFESLIRIASTVEAVTVSLDQLGVSTANLGIDAKMGIANMFDSVSDYQSAVGDYFKLFYSDAEQTAAATAQLTKVFGSIGVEMPDTIASYRDLVEAQDLTTAAGQEMYAQLIKLAPAFATVATAAQDAASAAAIVRERRDLELQLSQAMGDTAAVRAAELAKLDPSNRAIQERIYAIQDQQAADQLAQQQAEAAAQAAQQAAQAAEQLRQAWANIADGILDEIKRIQGLITGPTDTYATLLAQFEQTTALARAGDQDAAKSLPGISKQMLDMAEQVATSQQELQRIQGITAASLNDTWALITAGAFSSNDNRVSAQPWYPTLAASQAAPTASASDSLIAEVRELRADVDNNSGQMAVMIDRIMRVVERVSGATGGDAWAVEVEGTVSTKEAA